jgi:hypothetical protein
MFAPAMAAPLLLANPAQSAELKVLSGNCCKAAVQVLCLHFASATRHHDAGLEVRCAFFSIGFIYSRAMRPAGSSS